MASTQDFVEYVCEQVALAGGLTYKKMFGEYALYVEGKVVALVCDNQVFVRPTLQGKRLLDPVTEGAPYPGAKPHYNVNEHLDDKEFMTRLLLETAMALPAPKPKSKATAKSAKRPAAKSAQRSKA